MTSARDEILGLLPRGAVGAEIGVWTGDFSAQILAATAPQRLHLIDPFQTRHEPTYDAAWYGAARGADLSAVRDGVLERFAEEIALGQVLVHQAPSQQVLADIPPGSLDFLYIDGDHTYDAVRSDLELGFAACKPGGLICVDDYVLGRWWGDAVLRAVHEFLGAHARDCGVVFCQGGQVAIQVLPD